MLLSYLLDLRNIPNVHPELLNPLRKLRKPFKWSKRLKIKAILDCSNFGNAWLVLEVQNLYTYLLDHRNIPDGHPELQGPLRKLKKPFKWSKRLTIKAILDCSNFGNAWLVLDFRSLKSSHMST